MKVFNGLFSNVSHCFSSSVLTFGNFDGFHCGHQKLLQRLVDASQDLRSPSVVFTFEPHPIEVLSFGQSKNRIFSSSDLIHELQSFGVDFVNFEPFTKEFSKLSAEFFLKHVFQVFKPVKIIVGYDFHFGAQRFGDENTLEVFCKKMGIQLEVFDSFKMDGEIVSSTLIRNLIRLGDIKRANQYLGRPYFLSGWVVKGDQRGRAIGYPTANLNKIEDKILPQLGVYATKTLVSGKKMNSITNVGYRPTVKGFNDNLVIETYIFDFGENIYGEEIKIEFYSFLRPELNFSDLEELKNQIFKDIDLAQRYFKDNMSL